MLIAESSFFPVSDEESVWRTARVFRRRSALVIGAWVLLALLAIITYRLLIAQ